MTSVPAEILIASRYEVLRMMVGGFGLVFLSNDHQIDLPVVFKTIQPRFLSNCEVCKPFSKEDHLWMKLERHPYIMRCNEVIQPSQVWPETFLVLDWVTEAEEKTDRRGQPFRRGLTGSSRSLPNDRDQERIA